MIHFTIKKNLLIVTVIMCIGMLSFYLFSSSASFLVDYSQHSHEHGSCLSFKEYIPSEIEQTWIDHAEEWQDKVCPILLTQEDSVDKLQEYLEGGELPPTGKILSRYLHYNHCNDSIVESVIEPFIGPTRHPKLCWNMGLVHDKSYMIIDCTIPKLLPKHAKVIYLDLGASTWSEGNGGDSQSWIYSQYVKCGLKFDRIFAWEAEKFDPSVIWDQIPEEIIHTYHWFNWPCRVTNDSRNPYVLLQKIATVDDFVIVKMDIDNNPLETAFVEQILASPTILSLIDEFYFEHHINMEPMTPVWGSQDTKEKLIDSYNYFIPLRKAGIKAHAWV